MSAADFVEVAVAPSTQPDAVPPLRAVLAQLITGRFAAQAALVAARLGLADQIASGIRDTQGLAAALGAHEPSLRRLLRALASFGVVQEDGEDRWRLTPVGDLLRGDVPGSMRDLARWFGADAHYAAWGALEHSVRTGESAFMQVHGETCWAYMDGHPETAHAFNLGMTSLVDSFHRAILDVFDFSGIGTLVDVGGGQGGLMAAALARYPAMRGIVFDLERVVPETRARLAERGLSTRCQAVGGDFFEAVPPGGDAYIMTTILHDWDDEHAGAILRNCRAAMNPGGRVLVGDFVLKPSNEPDFGKLIDLEMLVMTNGGRERTEADFRRLFGEAGLVVSRIVPTPAGHCVIEGLPR